MAVLRILSRKGDSRVEWDADAVAHGDAEAMAAVQEAERILLQSDREDPLRSESFTGAPPSA